MVFKAKGAHTYKLRVTLADGRSATCSTGTTDRRTALDVEAMVARFKRQRRWDVLAPIVDKRLTLRAAYDANQAGTLDTLIAELDDIDLDPLVTEWADRAAPKYVRQVRRMIVAGTRYPLSRFRKKTIKAFLDGLSCDDPTRNRYRAALSSFSRWLMDHEYVEFNPALTVALYGEHDPRVVWMTWKQAKAAADAAPEPFRSLFAIMGATGIELGAALVIRATDVDVGERTIHARGTKRMHRNRVVRYEPWAAPYMERIMKPLVGAVLLFPDVTGGDALDQWKDAQKAVGLEGHTLHDLRHTYAVNALRKGYKHQVVAHQLGHKDPTMVTRVYGRYVPDASDYEVAATNPATNREKLDEASHGK